MKNFSAARRYARALYQLAKEKNESEDMIQAFSNLVQARTDTPDFARFLSNPLVTPEEKQQIVLKITSNKLILKCIYLLAKRKRMDLLPQIFDQVKDLSDIEHGRHRVLIRTPMVLSDAQKKTIETDLAKRLGGAVVGQFEVARELLGGIWVKVGDKVLDITLKGRIEDLRHTLVHSTN